jgi:hypothetical protein
VERFGTQATRRNYRRQATGDEVKELPVWASIIDLSLLVVLIVGALPEKEKHE